MKKHLFLLLFLLLTCKYLSCQVLPANGSKLNFTQIMFEHPAIRDASQYFTEVTLEKDASNFKNILADKKDSSCAVIIGDFEFGKKYAWRYTGVQDGKKMGWKGPYIFEIVANDYADKNHYRLRVLQNDAKLNAGGLIVMDEAHSIVDRKGNFVWVLPTNETAAYNAPGTLTSTPTANLEINDLCLTRFGTLTLINGLNAEEMDLNGNIVWKAPPKNTPAADTSAATGQRLPYDYHHCFKRLASGNYMAIDRVLVQKPALANTPGTNAITAGAQVAAVDEVIKEFDKNGIPVWSWSSGNYFDTAEWQKMLQTSPDPSLHNRLPGGHMNAFDVDEINGFVYAGFRNLSRVVKIDKQTGNVVCAWGDNMQYNGAPNANGFFTKQHGITLLHDGNLAVFNNNNPKSENTGRNNAGSSVVIFTQPANGLNSKLIWQFDCAAGKADNLSLRGGNVDELDNGNLLVCMGDVNSIFEVTRSKKIVWNALIEKREDSAWQPVSLFKAHYCSSLYPCYFTITTSKDTLKNTETSFQLRIFNDGTDEDSYLVSISSRFSSFKKQFTTAAVLAGKSVKFEINADKIPDGNETIAVLVESKTNPDFKRKLFVKYYK